MTFQPSQFSYPQSDEYGFIPFPLSIAKGGYTLGKSIGSSFSRYFGGSGSSTKATQGAVVPKAPAPPYVPPPSYSPAPPVPAASPTSYTPWIIGGIGVLAVGAIVFALTAPPKKKGKKKK